MWRTDIKYKYMFLFPLQNLARKELIVLNMSANKFTEVPHNIGCKISQGVVC